MYYTAEEGWIWPCEIRLDLTARKQNHPDLDDLSAWFTESDEEMIGLRLNPESKEYEQDRLFS